ncbi:MAG: SPASM domain-containing protein [Actinomycetota bacterium]
MSSRKDVARDLMARYKLYPRMTGIALSALSRRASVLSRPLRAQIETTTLCNLRCRMCPLREMKRSRGSLASEDFRRAYDAIRPGFLNLTGRGESLMNADIFEMVSHGKERCSFVKFDSNGTLFTGRTIGRIVDSGLDLVSVSLDSADPSVNEGIRVGCDHEAVVGGIGELVRARNAAGSTMKIHIGTVLQEVNVAGFVELVELGARLGVDRINPVPVEVYDLPGNRSFTPDGYRDELARSVYRYLESRDRLRVQVDVKPLLTFLRNPPGIPRRDRVCLVPWYSTYVSWEGNVFPCCYYYDGQVDLGNVFNTPFSVIWNGPRYREFRTRLRRDRDTLPICRTCTKEDRFPALLPVSVHRNKCAKQGVTVDDEMSA